jgi:tetratricopeptide (TPR) repeat protein
MKRIIQISTLVSLLYIYTLPATGQILQQPQTMALIQQGINHIYSFEFEEAQKVQNQLAKLHPGHPVTYLMRAFYMYWHYLPIKDNKAKNGEYVQVLNQCLAAVERQYGKNSHDPEALFFTLAAKGYIALMYNYQGEIMKAALEAQRAYSVVVESLRMTNRNAEFYFTTGLYNYYVVLYPQDHPIVKPAMIFFKDGDKALGLRQLETATRMGVITRAEAAYFLAHIYLEHESIPEKALHSSAKLVKWHPTNPIFRMIHTEALLLAGQYEEGKKSNEHLRTLKTGFYPVAWNTFEGIYAEKEEKDDALAERFYKRAISLPHDAQYTREYVAMAYAGLARIAHRDQKYELAKEYYKKCLTKAEYKSIVKEAKRYKSTIN